MFKTRYKTDNTDIALIKQWTEPMPYSDHVMSAQILHSDPTVGVNWLLVKLATLIEVDSKALFSIATILRYRGGCYSIPWIAPLYPWSLPYNSEC